MRNRKIAGTIFVVIGIIVLFLSALADVIGVGRHQAIFGYYQIAGIVVGVVGLVGGLYFILRKAK